MQRKFFNPCKFEMCFRKRNKNLEIRLIVYSIIIITITIIASQIFQNSKSLVENGHFRCILADKMNCIRYFINMHVLLVPSLNIHSKNVGAV